jgi:hypothetical protein
VHFDFFNGRERNYGFATLHPVAYLNLHGGVAVKKNIHARTKFDEADALAARHVISNFAIKNYAAGDQSRDLLENYGPPFALDCDDVLFVVSG